MDPTKQPTSAKGFLNFLWKGIITKLNSGNMSAFLMSMVLVGMSVSKPLQKMKAVYHAHLNRPDPPCHARQHVLVAK